MERGSTDGETRSQIARGLQPGERVVTEGGDRLREGAKVAAAGAPRRAPRAATARRAASAGRAARHSGRASAAGSGAPRRRMPAGRRQRRPRLRMSPSRPFILRPVATSLLMVAIVLVGLSPIAFLPLSALPQVDYPTIQVHDALSRRQPRGDDLAVTAPLERQFGQMAGLEQMTSTSAAGASVITLQFSLGSTLDVAEQEVQAAINAAGNLLPTDLPAPPVYAKVNPADAPVADAGGHSRHDAADRGRRTWSTPGWRRRSPR